MLSYVTATRLEPTITSFVVKWLWVRVLLQSSKTKIHIQSCGKALRKICHNNRVFHYLYFLIFWHILRSVM